MSVGHFAPFDLEGENAHPSWRLVPTTSFHEVHELISMKFYVIFSLTCLVWGSNVWVRYPSWKLSPHPTLFYPYVKVLFTLYRVNNILYMHPLDQYPTFIMLWDVANLRPIRYTRRKNLKGPKLIFLCNLCMEINPLYLIWKLWMYPFICHMVCWFPSTGYIVTDQNVEEGW